MLSAKPCVNLKRCQIACHVRLDRTMDYSLKRWTALSRYAQSAILPIDNNPVENVGGCRN